MSIGRSRLLLGVLGYELGVPDCLLGVLGYELGVPDCLIGRSQLPIDALCLMLDGSWLMAQGSWLMAHGQGGPVRPWGPRERQVRPGPAPALPRAPGPDRPPLAMSHEP